MANDSCLYFIQKFDSSLYSLYKGDGDIIALMPEVCYALDKKGIKYKILEDFYDFQDQKKYADGYFKRLSQWIDLFDKHIKDNIKDPSIKKIEFARLYGDHFKSMIDAVLVCCRNIEAVLNTMKPSKVHLIVEESELKFKEDPWYFSQMQELHYFVLPLICKKLEISYTSSFANQESTTTTLKPSNSMSMRKYIKYIFSRAKCMAKKIRNNFFYKLFLFKNNGLCVILLHDDGWLGNLRKDFMRSGWNIYPPIIYDNDLNIQPDYSHLKELWAKISQECMQKFIPCQWVNEEAGVDLSGIFNERFEFFLKRICPFINQEAIKYSKIIEQKKIKYVVCPYKIHPSDFAMMTAATIKEGVLSVQVEHGAGEIDDIWIYSEQPANVYIPSSRECVEYFDLLFNHENKMNTKVIPGLTWAERYERENKRNKKKFLNRKVSKKIYYLPSCQGLQRFNSSYPLSWYYCFQRDLVKYFSELKKFDFIIKVCPSVRWLSDPIRRLIEDGHFSNIFYEDGDLVKNLRLADKVITDYPSSPTHEARLLGLPTLSLYHPRINVRQSAEVEYGKTLAPFKSFEEARRIIGDFLNSPPEEYIVPVDNEFASPKFIDAIKIEDY